MHRWIERKIDRYRYRYRYRCTHWNSSAYFTLLRIDNAGSRGSRRDGRGVGPVAGVEGIEDAMDWGTGWGPSR